MRTNITLLKHGAIYLLARGSPAVVNFAALAVFTRILPAEEYGRYALIVAGAGLVQSVAFGWLRAATFRHYPRDGVADHDRFFSTVAAGYLCLVGLATLVGMGARLVAPSLLGSDRLWFAVIALACVQAHYELNLTLCVARLAPIEYGLLNFAKAVVSLLVAIPLVRLGWGAEGLAAGLGVAMVLPVLPTMRRQWRGLNPKLIDWRMLGRMVAYGVPLSISMVLGSVVFNIGRLLLKWFSGNAAVGLYAATYDLTQQTITMLMMVVNLAAHPLALHALEERGVQAARGQLRQSLLLLSIVALPAATGLALLRSSIASVMLGAGYRAGAPLVIPAAALAALLQGMKAYYLDLAFQLGRRTTTQIWPVLASSLANVGLSIWWVPRTGAGGAAWAACASYAVALVASWRLGRSAFPLPFPLLEMGRVALATTGMAVVVLLVPQLSGVFGLVAQITAGGGAYALFLWGVNAADVRNKLPEMVRRVRLRVGA